MQALIQIAGGDYWKPIIEQYISGKIDGYKAEEYFSEHVLPEIKPNFYLCTEYAYPYQEGTTYKIQNDSCNKSS